MFPYSTQQLVKDTEEFQSHCYYGKNRYFDGLALWLLLGIGLGIWKAIQWIAGWFQ